MRMFTTYKMTHPLSMSIFMKYFLPFKIGLLLSVDQLKDEISILERSLQVRNQLQALRNYEQGKNSVCFHVTVHLKRLLDYWIVMYIFYTLITLRNSTNLCILLNIK